MRTIYITIKKDRAVATPASKKKPRDRVIEAQVIRAANESDDKLLERLYAEIAMTHSFWREARQEPLRFRQWLDGAPQDWTSPSTGVPFLFLE